MQNLYISTGTFVNKLTAIKPFNTFIIPKPFVDQPNDAVHIKIRLAVRLHGQKLRFKFVVPAGDFIPDIGNCKMKCW